MRTVDVSSKPETLRSATAYGRIRLKPETIRAIVEGRVPKGDVVSACRLAGIMATKKTSELLPFCHPVSFQHVEVNLKLQEDCVEVFSYVKGIQRTGYEMEALTAVSVALLTLYDMCKGMDESMVIEEIKLLEKRGGKSQWSTSLHGVPVRVISECGIKELIEGKLTSLGCVLSEEDYELTISTEPVEFSEVWGISSAINQKLFSLLPDLLKRGVRVGKCEGKLCVEIQEDKEVIEAFFESFGSMLGNWLYGKAI
ncbi:MAG: cyclic pyranopterin monophosphate synthase MoaC [Aquificaceae bacterium]|nr:cyclic pyranopterin monophosphate synthase MoaC [Aquificaceae bacterium]MDW8424027.1 cyclic pyranopterin monophosphate synthase MoaC [Aquificaceae bacterium]